MDSVKWFLIALLAWGVYAGLEKVESDAWQAKAVRCAQTPDRPGCDDMATAAGNP